MTIGAPQARFYDFGPFSVDAEERRLLRDGDPVPLTPKAFDLLLMLIEHRGRLLQKPTLIDAIWPQSVVEDGNLAVTVFMIRKALGDGWIETVPRRGYRFNAEVTTRVLPLDAPARVRTAAAASLAILPFRSLSPNHTDEHLGWGIADALIGRLSNLRQISVRPTSAILKYAREENAELAARELGVDWLVEGTLRVAGERIRVAVQLIETAERRPVWSGRFDEDFTEIFHVEDSISERVANALMIKITGEDHRRLTRHVTTNTEAYNLCLKGRYFFSKETEEGVRKALDYLQRAIDLDAQYALAYAWMADCYCWLSNFYRAPRDVMPRAREAALRALAIDDGLAAAHTALALVRMFFERDFAGAERELQRALEESPNYAIGRIWYSFLLAAQRRNDEAFAQVALARENDPVSVFIHSGVGVPFYYAREYANALEHAERLIDMDPHLWTGYWQRGIVAVEQKRFELAIDSLQWAVALSERAPLMIAALGQAYAAFGKQDEARAILEELREVASRRYVSPYHLALIHTALGEIDDAFAQLERTYSDRSWSFWMDTDPKLDPLRGDARFQDLLARVGFGPREIED